MFKKEMITLHRFKAFLSFILLGFILPVHSFAATTQYQLDVVQSKVLFEADSTLHNIHGQVKSLNGKVEFDPVKGQVILPLQIEIPVASMDTGNSRRDQHMRKMFEANEYPVIRWTATQVNCRSGETPEIATMICDASGTLKIRNIQREKNFQVTLTFHDTQIQAQGEWSLNRKDFDLKTPSLLGVVRVSQEVKVSFDTVWKQN